MTKKPVLKKSSTLLGKGVIKTPMSTWKSKKTEVPLTKPRTTVKVPKYLDKVRVDKKKRREELVRKQKSKLLSTREQQELNRLVAKAPAKVQKKLAAVVKTVPLKVKKKQIRLGPTLPKLSKKVSVVIDTDTLTDKRLLQELRKMYDGTRQVTQQNRKVVHDSTTYAQQNPHAMEEELKGHELFVLADQEGLLIRDLIKWDDLLAKIDLTPGSCTAGIRSYAAAFTAEADSDLRERVKLLNERANND